MIIKYHSARNFRNLDDISFEPHPEMNVIYGENGQGKLDKWKRPLPRRVW